MASQEEWRQDLKDFERQFAPLKEKFDTLKQLAEQVHTFEKESLSAVKKLRKSAASLEKGLNKLEKSGKLNGQEASELRGMLTERQNTLKKIAFYLPMDISLPLRLMLGNVNLTLPYMHDRFRYKQEYETFKLKATYTLIAGAFLCLMTVIRPLDALYYVFLAWFYGSMTVRELILMANGSRIKTWWLVHHYVAIALSIIMVVWPPSESYYEFRTQFMAFSFYLGIVQLVQYRYQAAVLYKKRALGQSQVLDTTTDMPHKSTLTVLLFMLAAVYVFQLYNAYVLLDLSMSPRCTEWQPAVIGCMFLVLGIGNSYITSSVVYGKYIKSEKPKPKL